MCQSGWVVRSDFFRFVIIRQWRNITEKNADLEFESWQYNRNDVKLREIIFHRAICAENVTKSLGSTRETTFLASSCGTSDVNVLRMEDIMGREENKAVFENTIKLCIDNPKLNESVKKSVENQNLFPESLSLPEINTARTAAQTFLLRICPPLNTPARFRGRSKIMDCCFPAPL